jgi:hypothetical protein
LRVHTRHPSGGPSVAKPRWRSQRAAAVVQLAVLAPVFLLLVTGSVQAALWQEADHVAQAAAQLGNGVLVSPSVTATTRGDEVTVTVTGSAEQLVPGLVLHVTDRASAPREELPLTT